MVLNEESIRLKDGRTAVLKSPTEADAAELVAYLKQSAGETDFLMAYPEERNQTAAQEAEFLRKTALSPDSAMLLCRVEGKVAGTCQIIFSSRLKIRHRATVAVGILKEYWRLGIGTAMFRALTAAARERGVTQMELDVMEGNERAMALYEKVGFRPVAEIPNAFHLKDGTVRKEIHMILSL